MPIIRDASTLEKAKDWFDNCEHGMSFSMSQGDICSSAAEHGNLQALQYLRSLGCAWDTSLLDSAAEHGHLHIIQWARENGCDFDLLKCKEFAKRHPRILEYLNQ